MCPITPSAFRGVLGWWGDDVVNQRPGMWRTSHPWVWTDGRRGLRVEAIGSKTAPRQTGQTPSNTIQTMERGVDHEHEACGTAGHQRCDPPPFEAEQRNHSRRHHLPDRIMLRGHRNTGHCGGRLDPVGRDRGTVTPRNSGKHKH